MPNWCSNTLKVYPTSKTKKAVAQLHQFMKDVVDEGQSLTWDEAEKFRQKYLKSNLKTIYKDDVTSFVKHTEMFLNDFMVDVAGYKEMGTRFVINYEPFSMQKLLPVPKELLNPDLGTHTGGALGKKLDALREKMIKKYGFGFCNDWRVHHWGTKWDVDAELQFDEENSIAEYEFESAWSPINEFLEAICEKYPLLTFDLSFVGEGNEFKGELLIVSGEVIIDYCGDCDEEDNDDDYDDDETNEEEENED